MRKIPTVFMRDPDNRKHVIDEVTPGCEWVLAGEGVPTRKYDGTCVMCDDSGVWWARREVKMGKPQPYAFMPSTRTPATGKLVGWEPIGQSGFVKFFAEALDNWRTVQPSDPRPGTYELCGPKINRNPEPEGFDRHVLVPHGCRELQDVDGPTTFGELHALLTEEFPYEGIVWHHPDGRMAKLKKRDFPLTTQRQCLTLAEVEGVSAVLDWIETDAGILTECELPILAPEPWTPPEPVLIEVGGGGDYELRGGLWLPKVKTAWTDYVSIITGAFGVPTHLVGEPHTHTFKVPDNGVYSYSFAITDEMGAPLASWPMITEIDVVEGSAPLQLGSFVPPVWLTDAYGSPIRTKTPDEELAELVPALMTYECKCPSQARAEMDPVALTAVIQHLNDLHRWNRGAIADWLESLPDDVDLTFSAASSGN